MFRQYRDILDRIPEPPKWFDERAVPRYCEFSPRKIANIYSRETALVLIKCQGCGTEFQVAFSEANLTWDLWDTKTQEKVRNISDLIKDGRLHYGDPPNIDCCAGGATMNSIPIKVLEYWYQPIVRGEGVEDGIVTDLKALEFRRDPGLEIELESWFTKPGMAP